MQDRKVCKYTLSRSTHAVRTPGSVSLINQCTQLPWWIYIQNIQCQHETFTRCSKYSYRMTSRNSSCLRVAKQLIMFYYLIFYLLLCLFLTAKTTMLTPQGKAAYKWCGSPRKYAALLHALHTSHRSLSFCYHWSWFEARSKICLAERHAKIREKEFRLCTIHWYIVNVWTLRLLVLISWLCLSREGKRLAFS